jgi:hypothetical protein
MGDSDDAVAKAAGIALNTADIILIKPWPTLGKGNFCSELSVSFIANGFGRGSSNLP